MLKIPEDMVEASGLIFAGEYDINYDPPPGGVILDIGANIGAFASWASFRWPGVNIHCYEPIKETYNILLENTRDKTRITCHNVAVGEKDEKARQMYYGVQNRGQCSFIQTPEQRSYGESVDVVAAASLPQAHIVKLDVEGAELEIISNMTYKPIVYVLEYHSPRKQRLIKELLSDYTLIESKMENISRGTMKFIYTARLHAAVDPDLLKRIEF